MPKYGVFSGTYFPIFQLNTEIYGVNLRIQSEYRKIWTRKNSIFAHFLHSVVSEKLRENLTLFHRVKSVRVQNYYDVDKNTLKLLSISNFGVS